MIDNKLIHLSLKGLFLSVTKQCVKRTFMSVLVMHACTTFISLISRGEYGLFLSHYLTKVLCSLQFLLIV